MEEKLLELFICAKKYNEFSTQNYVDVKYDGSFNRIVIEIRNKDTHEFLETREICLNKPKIEELIKTIKEYEVEENEKQN